MAGDIGSMGVGKPPDPEVVRPSLLSQLRSKLRLLLTSGPSKSIDFERFDCLEGNLGNFGILAEVFSVSGVVGADLAVFAESLIFCRRAKVLLRGAGLSNAGRLFCCSTESERSRPCRL